MVVIDLTRRCEVDARDVEHALHSATNASGLFVVASSSEHPGDTGERAGKQATLVDRLSQRQVFTEERICPCEVPSLHSEGSHEVEGVRGYPDIPTRAAQGMCLLDQ